MKSFFWKFVLCFAPCVLAGLVTWNAVVKYFEGEPGGFKLGVDLVGGTILVYEIDLRKQEATKDAGASKSQDQQAFDPVKDINVLAEALKKRIDPNDLYNIVIRPAGGEGRVEIILPTGGKYRSEKADRDWQELVSKIESEYTIEDAEDKKKLEVPRGRIFELADAVQLIKAQNLWGERLLNNQEAWDRMTMFTDMAKTAKEREEITERNDKEPRSAEFFFGSDLLNAKVALKEGQEPQPAPQVIRALWKPGENVDLTMLVKVIDKALASTGSATSEAVVKMWIKNHAWHQLLQKAMHRKDKTESGEVVDWTWLQNFKAELNRIPPDNNEQLIGFIQSGGTFIGQAGLFALENIIGANPLDSVAEEEGSRLQSYKLVKDFIENNYGPSHRSIVRKIQVLAAKQGRGRDITVEEVQRIKEQVARVGLLEFRILANEKDDREGIEEAKLAIKNAGQLLKDNAEKGLPPPGPVDRTTGQPKIFPISLARGQKSFVTYGWVELSRQQRKDLNLDNAAKDDPARAAIWKKAETKIDEAFELQDYKEQPYFKGALFYKRLTRDRNLNPEERERKKYDYFVLTREPEFEQNDKGEILKDKNGVPVRTPRIDGGYLISAMSGTSQDFRPAVHFAFNAAGAKLFGDITSKNVPDESGSDETRSVRHLAIILDAEVMSAPTIQSTIRDRGQISGSFTQKEVESLVNTLRAGRLPATLKPEPVSESTMGPTLGADTIRAGVFSLMIAFGAVLIFMIIYYRFAGIVASVSLLSSLLLTVGFMVAVQATFTLPGLAGLVLMIGMAVDSNILIYERLREERERGANLATAIRNGYERATPTIYDTHLSSIFTAVVLYVVGNDQLKGFGVSLTVGLLVSLFTTLFMTRVLFDFWLAKGWLHKLSMLRFFARPNINFMAIRKPMFITTITLGILGFALFFGRAPFNIDFVGGTAFGSQLTKPVSIGELRELVDDTRQDDLLNVVEVVELDPVSGGAPSVGKDKDGAAKPAESTSSFGRYYQLTYKTARDEADKVRKVTLLNPPDLPTKEEREAAVKKLASKLRDVAVEQQFPSFAEVQGDKSAYFVIRTTEKEPELVQAALDRLLREENGVTLLKRSYIEADFRPEDRMVLVSFFDKDPEEFKDNRIKLLTDHRASGSPLFFKSLFTKELLKAFGVSDRSKLPPFDVRGEGASTSDGSYHSLSLKFEKAPDLKDRDRIETAIVNTVASFNSYIQPDRLENFDSQLATETRYRALWAILASWVAVMVYLWFRFGNWTFGLAAVVCLIHDLFITLGVIALAHYFHGGFLGSLLGLEDFKLDLPAVAALLTLVGYSVNDTIVVFDRIREVRGKNPDLNEKMINDSVNQTLSRTILASTTTWLVVFVLYVWGGPGVKLFSFIMVVGVIIGTYSSIYIASPLLLWFGEGNKEKDNRHRPINRPAPEGAVV